MKFRFFIAALAACLALRLVAQTNEPMPTVVESDGPAEMVSTDKDTTITWRDNVRVTGTGIRLTCDALTVVVIRSGDKAATLGKIEKFRSLVATGNVHIVQVDREAACGRAEVLPGDDKIILYDKPVIVFRSEGARQSGRKITLHKGERRVEIEDPVTTLPEIKDLGYDKDQKSAKPADAAPPAKDGTGDNRKPEPPPEAPKQP